MPNPGMYGRLGKVPRRTQSNRVTKSPTDTANPGEIVSGSRIYQDNATTDTHDWLIPNGMSVGDMLWAAICVRSSADDLTAPSGWVEFINEVDAGEPARYYVYYKIADGTETDSTWVWTSGATRVAAVFWRTESNGVTFGTPEVGTVSTDVAGGVGDGVDPNPITPSESGTYAVYTVTMANKGSYLGPSANYEEVGFAVAESVARRPRTFVQQRAVAITTSEDPGEIDWQDGALFQVYRTWTIGLRLDVGAPALATGDHTHTEDEVDDIDTLSEKASPVAADRVKIYDSEDTDTFKYSELGNLPVATHASTHSDGGPDEIDVADLASGAATDGYVATADGSGGVAWEAVPAGGSVELDDLTDVTISSPSNGEVLKYNGSAWVNDTDATGGGGGSASQVGRSTIGASWLGLNAARRYVVNIGELTAGQVVLSVAAYLRMTAENVAGAFNAGLYRDDGAGVPGTLLGIGTGMGYATNQIVFDANDERWFHLPLGVYIPATDDYWVALWIGDVDNTQLAYDNSGGDSGYITASGAWWIEKDVSGYGFTAETNDYSMHAVVL